METRLYFFWSSISLALFYLFYLMLFKRETFFLLNRIYLLSALCLSIGIPLLDLSQLMGLPKMELMISTLSVIGGKTPAIVVQKELDWLPIIYWIGVFFSAMFLLVKLFGVARQIKIQQKGNAFSFWKTKVIDQELADFVTIDAHENVHIKQLHTLDIVLIELIRIFFWFNPLIYFYRNSLKLIHEYLADEHAANLTGSKKQYAMVLFLQNFKAGPDLANTFYNPSLLKARVRMLQREKSNAYRLWKYVICMPLVILMLMLCSFSTSHLSSDGTNKIDQPARFPGGFEAFSNFLIKTTRKVSGTNGRVEVSFTVESDGTISNEKVENGLDHASDKEILRVIKSSPRWEPALLKGKKVRSAYQIGININTDNQTNK